MTKNNKQSWTKIVRPQNLALRVYLALFLFAFTSLRTVAAETAAKQPDRVNKWPKPVMDNEVIAHMLLDQFEGRASANGNQFRWDGEGWMGTDWNRLWIKSEGFANSSGVSDGDHEVLYDRPIPKMRYFDAQAGLRADLDSDPSRAWAAIGIEGLAPYRFEFAPTFYIRNDGHVAGRIEGLYDLRVLQRLVLEPQAELDFYSKDDPSRKIGSGLSDVDAGIRLRYEIRRKFAPYVGWTYHGEYGDTRDYSLASGEHAVTDSFVFGIRMWR